MVLHPKLGNYHVKTLPKGSTGCSLQYPHQRWRYNSPCLSSSTSLFLELLWLARYFSR
ncbi:hypothetical protein F383_35202 [Gossypium arboreum]|uniref:Uncharacterized protein n=1 Tax=Gossypium arboreum TaxID=29729 RepID=A0A0B0N5N7_GOSAR|nr:hypothetical protein F383_35202 [Gossypium arboreum]